MNITREWLEKHDACSEGQDWFAAQTETDSVKLVEKLMDEDRFEWANWLIVRIMTRPQYLAYAIFAAEQMIGIYEARYPNDSRPRVAIEAARRVLDDDSAENRAAARVAAEAAEAAAAAWAWAAAEAAARVTRDEAAAAWAWAAAAAAWAWAAAAWAAARAAEAARAVARAAMQRKIINHGLDLIREA